MWERQSVFGALFGLGVMSASGKSAKQGMMEAAFGSPDADRAFLGTELSGRYLAGSILGGSAGGLMRASAPFDYLKTNPIAPGPKMQLATTIGGGIIGGAIGGFGLNKRFGAVGAIGGAILGAVAPLAYTGTRIQANSDFYSQSPYARSRQLANELNASGDIVLGMYNSRGGY